MDKKGGRHQNPSTILKRDRLPNGICGAQHFDITGHGTEHFDLTDGVEYDTGHTDYVPDSVLNALLDEQEASEDIEAVTSEAASSSSGAPTYTTDFRLTEAQSQRIARNR